MAVCSQKVRSSPTKQVDDTSTSLS